MSGVELFGRELTTEQVIGFVRCNATPNEDLIHRAALELVADLEASKRRESAAVEDLKHLADMGGECYGCKHYDGIRCDHAIYRVTCNTETDNHYEWRGPEQEGEANHE